GARRRARNRGRADPHAPAGRGRGAPRLWRPRRRAGAMSAILLLIGGSDPEAPMAWAQIDDAGAIEAQGVLAPGAQATVAPPARAVPVLPGADARVKLLDLPARTAAEARAGAPFLFEGALAEDDEMHWAVGAAQNEAGRRLVAAISAPR